MKNKSVVVNIFFNTFNFTQERFSKEWIDQRISIFMQFTLKSLKIQTNQDFLTLVYYDKTTEGLIKRALDNFPPLPENIKFISKQNDPIKSYISESEYLYLARMDSDDLYHKSFIQQLSDYAPDENTEILINQKGYMYDSINNFIAGYFYCSPQFYTFIYRVEDYLKGKRYRTPGGHSGAILLKHEILDKPNFMLVVHPLNVLKTFKDKNRGGLITDPAEAKAILKEFMG